MTTTTESNPKRFYSLSILDDQGQEDIGARDYIRGLMQISGKKIQQIALYEAVPYQFRSSKLWFIFKIDRKVVFQIIIYLRGLYPIKG
jgi:hypothetical protein